MKTLGKFQDFKVNCDKISEIVIQDDGAIDVFTEIEMDQRPIPEHFLRYEGMVVEEVNPVYFIVTAKIIMSDERKKKILEAAEQYRIIESNILAINNQIAELEDQKRELWRDKWVWIEER